MSCIGSAEAPVRSTNLYSSSSATTSFSAISFPATVLIMTSSFRRFIDNYLLTLFINGRRGGRQHFAIPARHQIHMNAELIEDAHHRVIHQFFDRSWMIVKRGNGRQNRH